MAIMVDAHDAQTVSKIRAFKISLNALSAYPLTLFSKSFVWLFVKMIVRN